MNNLEVINNLLADLLEKTRTQKIIWTQVNQNVIRWVKQPNPVVPIVTVTLQKQINPNPGIRENYILTVQNSPTDTTQINTAVETSLKDILLQLFNAGIKEANNIAEQKKIDVLKNLLKDI